MNIKKSKKKLFVKSKIVYAMCILSKKHLSKYFTEETTEIFQSSKK